METRSSPALGLLQRLARQARIDTQDKDISLLSKPALFGHLRSHYDYQRLERAHQIAIKRGSDDVRGNDSSSSSGSGSSSSGSKKRQCRPVKAVDGGGSSSASSASSSSAPSSAPSFPGEEQEALPPASIFVQTRSRSRMLLAAADGARPGTRLQQSASSARRSASTSPRPRTKLQLGGGKGKRRGGGSGSGGIASGNAGCSSDGAEATPAPTQTPAPAPAAPERKSESEREAACESSEDKAKRKRQEQEQKQQQCRNGKGKGKARESGGGGGGGGGGKDQSCGSKTTSSAHDDGGSSGTTTTTTTTTTSKESPNLPNELDPIMLVKVGKDHHRFVRPNGRVVMYNLDSLVDYFISTGDFLEPETRLPFSDEELRTIDLKAKAAGLSKPSVLEAKRDPGRYAEQKFQQDALVGLERMTSELVTAMLRVVEGCDREEGEIRLVTEIFPPFADLFKQIYAADKAFALQCMQHYTSWLEGPPNRPTEDEMGFLDIILGFLKQLQECGGGSSLGF